jgi:hypothetical protein
MNEDFELYILLGFLPCSTGGQHQTLCLALRSRVASRSYKKSVKQHLKYKVTSGVYWRVSVYVMLCDICLK